MKIRLLNKFEGSFNVLEIDDNCESILDYIYCFCFPGSFLRIYKKEHITIKRAGYDASESWNDDLYYVSLGDNNLCFVNKIPIDYDIKYEI